MTRYVTNSEITDYLTCRRSWAVKHVYRLGPEREHVNVSRERGNFVHSALEAYYSSGMEDDLPAAIELAHARLLEALVDDDGLLPDEDVAAAAEAKEWALTIVEGYIEWLAETGADSDLTLLAAEERIEWPILKATDVSDEVVLLGKRDAVFRRERDGARVVFDHKVVQSFSDMEKTAHLSPQFKTYLALDRAATVGWVDGLVVNMLRASKRTARAKGPFYDRLEVRHNDTTLRRHWAQMTRTVSNMVVDEMMILGSDEYFETAVQPLATRDCSWRCSFYNGCQLVDDGSDWQGYLDMAFVPINPIARYEETA